jgi:hypothetical protein
MNLIFRDLLGVLLEVYIDDVVVKSSGFDADLADVCVAFERMKKIWPLDEPTKVCVRCDSREVFRFCGS